jgi:putative transcriptional regulator
MTTDMGSLAGRLLIAMPNLADPNFHRSVVLIGVHSADDGAFGLVVNRPTGVPLGAVLDELGHKPGDDNLPEVLSGGPVETQQGFVLFENAVELIGDEVLAVEGGVAVSGSTEVLARLVENPGAQSFYLVLGYSGWSPGQLEQEIEENSWLVAPLDPDLVFRVPLDERWNAALRALGVDPGTLVDSGGSSTPS